MTEFWRSTALPHLEARRSCQENSCYRPHAHDTFSIGAIDAGTSQLAGPLGGTVRLEPGDVVAIPTGHVHSCNPDEGPWQYQMVHMDQNWARSLAPRRGSSHLFAGITVVRHPDAHARANLLAALDTAASVQLAVQDSDPDLLSRLAPVMHRLRWDESNPALDELAASVGMTTYQLFRSMRRATGLTPLAWRQNARVVRGRRMLRQGRPITETAHALGFTDQSHFHRVFRAHVAASPGTYQG